MCIRICRDRYQLARPLANGGKDKVETVTIKPLIQGTKMCMVKRAIKDEDLPPKSWTNLGELEYRRKTETILITWKLHR